MADLQVSLLAVRRELLEPLIDGRVKPEGIDLSITCADPNMAFWREGQFEEFDVSVASISTVIAEKRRGLDVVGLPVFPTRRFMHTEVHYHVDSGIEAPADLDGKRMGLNHYTMTTGIFIRGALQHDFGVPPERIEWHVLPDEGTNVRRGGTFVPPEGVVLRVVAAGKNLHTMLADNEIDAMPLAVGRGVGDRSKVKPLFPDRMAECARFFREHGFMPATNIYTIRGEVYRKHPWIALNLYQAMAEAKRIVDDSMAERIPGGLLFGKEYAAQTKELLGGQDPFPYGIEANRRFIDTLSQWELEQGFMSEIPSVEELFAPATLSS